MEVDEAIGLASSFKSRQLVYLLLVSVTTLATIGFHGLAVINVGWEPPHHCKQQVGFLLNQSVPKEMQYGASRWSRCSMYINATMSNATGKCTNGWQYQNSGYNTIVTEWNLVCDRNYLSELAQTIYQVGAMVSALTIGQLSDRFGRKKMFVICHIFTAAIGIGLAFIRGYIAFVVLRFAIALAGMGAFMAGEVYVIETFDSTRRTVAFAFYNALWPFIYWLFGLLGYFIQEWRHLYLVLSLPSLLSIVYSWAIPESLFWMCAKGRYEEAEKILNKMAKNKGLSKKIQIARSQMGETEKVLNGGNATVTFVSNKSCTGSDTGTEISNNLHISSVKNQIKLDNNVSTKMTTRQPLVKLFRDKYLRRHVFITSFFIFTSCLIYFGIALSTPTFAGNRHFNYFLLGIPEFIAKTLLFLMGRKFEHRLERRRGTCICYIITGITLGALTFIPNQTASGVDLQPLIITIVVFAKFAVSCSFWILGFYIPELLPTALRSSGHGMAGFAGGLGGVVAPFGAYAAKTLPWVPNVTYAVFAFCGCLLVLLLPETVGRPLPQEIQHVHSWYQKNKTRTKSEQPQNKDESKELCVDKVSTC